MRTLKLTLAALLVGASAGAFSVYQYLYTPFVAVIADRGYCSQRDVRGVVFVYACRDAAVAMELTARAIEADHAAVDVRSEAEIEAKAIVADMSANQPRRGTAKGKKP